MSRKARLAAPERGRGPLFRWLKMALWKAEHSEFILAIAARSPSATGR
jgi:hypothetical protein